VDTGASLYLQKDCIYSSRKKFYPHHVIEISCHMVGEETDVLDVGVPYASVLYMYVLWWLLIKHDNIYYDSTRCIFFTRVVCHVKMQGDQKFSVHLMITV
jgi:hypothetical protein